MDLEEKQKNFKDTLQESYNNPKPFISKKERYELAVGLLEISRVVSDNILKLATILNRKSEDSYYIVYGLLMQYNSDMLHLNGKNFLSIDDKTDALEESFAIISKNVDNKEFMDQLYLDIRLGTNIEKIYYPEHLNRELLQSKNFAKMLEKLKTSERF